MCKSVEQICVTLWSSFLRLSTKSGQTLCQGIAASCQSIIRSTCELMVNLSKCSKRHESLQKVGEVWQKYDEIKGKIPRENAQAVQLKIQVTKRNTTYLVVHTQFYLNNVFKKIQEFLSPKFSINM